MAQAVDSPPSGSAFGRLLYGTRERIAGTIYGTIVVMAVLAAGSDSDTIDAWELDVLMVGTVVILWVAHVYAHALAESLTTGRRLSRETVSGVAGREVSIVLSAGPSGGRAAAGRPRRRERRSTRSRSRSGSRTVTLGVQGVRYARAALSRLGRSRLRRAQPRPRPAHRRSEGPLASTSSPVDLGRAKLPCMSVEPLRVEAAPEGAVERRAGVFRYYELAKRAEWQVRDVPWGDIPPIPETRGSAEKKARRQDVWRSVITQQYQADILAVKMAAQLLNAAPHHERASTTRRWCRTSRATSRRG